MDVFSFCITLFFLALVVSPRVQPYNILITALGSKSQKLVFEVVSEELGQRGHQVTILCTIGNSQSLKGVKEVIIPDAQDLLMNSAMYQVVFGQTGSSFSCRNKLTQITEFITNIIDLHTAIINMTYSSQLVRDIVKYPRGFNGSGAQFDLLITEPNLFEFTLPLAYLMGVPSLFLSTISIFAPTSWNLNIPYPFVYLTNGVHAAAEPRTFYERVTNLLGIMGSFLFRFALYRPSLDKMLAHFVAGLPSLSELERNVSFVLTNTHSALNPPTPGMPYSADVGCLHCHPAKPLSKKLEDFMQSAEPYGVVYFSFGTILQEHRMTEMIKNKFVKAFTRLPQKIIWTYTEESKPKNVSSLNQTMPENVMLIDWVPQQDILGHPKLKALLTHGGALSVMEAAYHGVPLVGFPLAIDGFNALSLAVNRGFAMVMDINDFTVDELVEKLKMVIVEDRFKERAKMISKVMNDFQVKPTEKAAYHIEYVIRHQGARHLKSGAEHFNSFQYFLLDIIGFSLLAFTLIIFTLKVLLKYLLKIVGFIIDKSRRLKKMKLL